MVQCFWSSFGMFRPFVTWIKGCNTWIRVLQAIRPPTVSQWGGGLSGVLHWSRVGFRVRNETASTLFRRKDTWLWVRAANSQPSHVTLTHSSSLNHVLHDIHLHSASFNIFFQHIASLQSARLLQALPLSKSLTQRFCPLEQLLARRWGAHQTNRAAVGRPGRKEPGRFWSCAASRAGTNEPVYGWERACMYGIKPCHTKIGLRWLTSKCSFPR